MALAGRLWRRAMTEFSGISGVKGRSFPPPSVDKQFFRSGYQAIQHPVLPTGVRPSPSRATSVDESMLFDGRLLFSGKDIESGQIAILPADPGEYMLQVDVSRLTP
jgi:hypothetical protein